MLIDVYGSIMITSLGLGLVAGFVMHRASFCMAGACRDLFLVRRADMARQLVLLIVISMAIFEISRLLGVLRPYPFPLLGAPSLANVIGGFFFGVGMILAGGCVVGTLYKMGSGSVLSGVAFTGLIIGSTLYAEIHPAWKQFMGQTTLTGKITLPQLLDLPPTPLVAVLLVAAMPLLWRWWRDGRLVRRAHASGYLQPWLATVILALLGLVSWLVVGMPLGITTSYAKMGGWLEQLVFPDHVAGLAFFKATPLAYVHPLSGELLKGGPGPLFDAIAAIQLPLIFGITAGAAVSAVRLGEFRPHLRVPAVQYLSALAGGVIMGLASRLAPACNIWHLLGGLPILALQSILFVVGMLPGAWLGSRLLARLVIK